MSPRRKGPRPNPDDWRTDAQRADDARLTGTWWRCFAHGLITGPLMLGAHAYCPDLDCANDRPVLLAHSVMQDKVERNWNDGPKPVRRGAAPRPELPVDTGDDASLDQMDDDDEGSGPALEDESEPAEAPVDQDAQGPPQETPVQTTTNDASRTAAEMILLWLLAAGDRVVTAGDLRKMIRAQKPGTSHGLTDTTLLAMRKRGHVVRDGVTYRLTDAGRTAALCARTHGGERQPAPVPAPRKPRSVAPERAVETSAPEPDAPTASSQVEEGETLSPAPIAVPLCVAAFSGELRIRVSKPMLHRLGELLEEGFHGHSVEEVAERFLARALRSFSAAN